MTTTATVSFRGRRRNWEPLTNVPVVNPGCWFGDAYLVEIDCGYSSLFFVVESGGECDVIDEFSDSEYGHLIHVPNEDVEDIEDDDRYYDGSGHVLDLDEVRLYGPRDIKVRYHAEGLPEKGINPKNYDQWLNWKDNQQHAAARRLSTEGETTL